MHYQGGKTRIAKDISRVIIEYSSGGKTHQLAYSVVLAQLRQNSQRDLKMLFATIVTNI